MADRLDEAEDLLTQWYAWTVQYRPHLGYPRVAPYCRQFRTSRQYEDGEARDTALHSARMESVNFCVSCLTSLQCVTIDREMRRRYEGWTAQRNNIFVLALHDVIPIMRDRGLLSD